MQREQLAYAQQSFMQATEALRHEQRQFEHFQADYRALRQTLTSLTDKTSHPAMIPLGSLAFMPGRLVHTNEIMVLLGDNWFVERSAKQAAEIVLRREQFVDQRLAALERQLKSMQTRTELTHDYLAEMDDAESGEIMHIVEPVPDTDADDQDDEAARNAARARQGSGYLVSNDEINSMVNTKDVPAPSASSASASKGKQPLQSAMKKKESSAPVVASPAASASASSSSSSSSSSTTGPASATASTSASAAGSSAASASPAKSVHFNPDIESVEITPENIRLTPASSASARRPLIMEIENGVAVPPSQPESFDEAADSEPVLFPLKTVTPRADLNTPATITERSIPQPQSLSSGAVSTRLVERPTAAAPLVGGIVERSPRAPAPQTATGEKKMSKFKAEQLARQ
ncbi:hypothetical protein CAOG_06514 [Capsaspora owczarzaki ATCC 30864]|uniref:Uncharacterized protein n=1 Tax=Capsaspora owczarzaki (strain ATCC 30864) TaxID=595528 RepID=A0A0D2X4J1_CAPO3|nr:hypothetical protein CAOG_06514 [Capsaspora owczarzaki ATCC 30864]KJE96149.1 hypothetical protein CAOG_006514 [Capsaspora owczarzaki ATCC 30864]|eukprot:XP_004345263.1 hypothetical protein CAOG_06514 [Capsaspora owczarzaki ATCC 30864]